MAQKRLQLTRGDSHTFTLTFKKASDSTPYCLKNWVIFFTIKSNWDIPDSQAALQKIVTSFPDSISGTTGIADINLLPADTANITPGEYDFDIAVCTAANESLTILKGKIDIEYDVTRTAGTAGTAP